MDPQIFNDISLEQIKNTAQEYKERGWRLTNLCGSSVEGKVELLYSYAQGKELENARVVVSNEDEVPSVSAIYPGIFIFENETHDLFGVNFTDISIDYEGAFYPTSVPTPMNPSSNQAKQFLASEEENRG